MTQVKYAMDDVRHLLELKATLTSKLNAMNRYDWFTEEMSTIVQVGLIMHTCINAFSVYCISTCFVLLCDVFFLTAPNTCFVAFCYLLTYSSL